MHRKPLRMDAQDGPWSVSVAENPQDMRTYTIYIQTPTHHLTLTRTASEVAELHHKLADVHPSPELPPLPLTEPPTKRRSSFLHTLSRLANTTPKPATQHRSSLQYPTPSVSPSREPDDPFTNPLSAPSAAATSLAAYLTAVSNSTSVRTARPWRRFVRVRTDDLESVRVERAIKRVRSDLAIHHPAPAPASHSIMSQLLNSQHVVESDVESVPSIKEEDENEPNGDADADAEENLDDAELRANAKIAELLAAGETVDEQALVPPLSAAVKPDSEPALEPDMAAEIEAEATPVQPPIPVEVEVAPTPAPMPTPAITPSVTEPLTPAPAPEVPPASASEVASPEPIPPSAPVPSSPSTPVAEPAPVADFLPTPAPSPASPSPPPLPHRIPRSASADPDKASRLSRAAWLPSDPTPSPSPRTPKRTTIDDFEMLRVLGKGCAGKVLLVRHRASSSLYALKAITKRHVLAHQELQHTLTEQAVLKRMAHEARDPFVVKLWWSFHDKENLFLVMDFHPGGDLATQLARWGRLGRDRARFYAAEIVEGVDGLHAAGVIYRDLKPENILIGADGHIVLTDFGLSKEFPRRPTLTSSPSPEFYSTPGTPGPSPATPHWMQDSGSTGAGWVSGKDSTSTFCGTAEYLAPEVIQGLPYSYEVDWWSFGTMLYEMLTGITPFWANNHSDMYVRVLQDELQFPEDKAMDQDTKSLIRGLLQRNPALRMSEPRIKRHPYFSMIDWSHVYYKRYIPPYIPPIDPSNASDTQNFDEAFLDMDPTIEDRDEVDESSPERQVPQVPEEGDDEKDLFDGYSFKGRNSVIIDEDLVIGEEEKEEEPEPEPEPEEAPTPPAEDLSTPEIVSTPELQPVSTPEAELLEPEPEVKVEPETQVEDEQEAPETPTSASVPTPTLAPIPPISTSTSLPSTSAPVPPPKTAFRSLDPSRPSKAVTIAPPASHSRRREKSGVPALDRARNADLDGSATEREEEEDDWDFVETPGGEDRNGSKGTSLFARGVVDRYRLAVFRKTSGNGRSFSGASSTLGAAESDMGSPESGEKKRGRLAKSKGKFLRARSPPAGGVFGGGMGMGNRSTSSGTVMSISSGATLHSQSLRSKDSTTSMGSPNGSASSDAEDVGAGTTTTGRKLKKMTRYKEGAEKVLSLFGSPRQERTQAQS